MLSVSRGRVTDLAETSGKLINLFLGLTSVRGLIGRRTIHQRGRRTMTYVVTEGCIKCKFTDCVDVCPVDCFREGPNFLVIDPDECIDCTLCVAECPADAIFAEDDVPADQQDFIELNAELARLWKPIIESKDGMPDADDWVKVKDKRGMLER